MTAEDDSWRRLLDGLRAGDQQIIREFWEAYGPPLHRLADRHLNEALRRRVEPEDVVQSVMRTFLRRIQIGQFKLAECEDLWRLLCAVTLNKVRHQTRHHLRGKRSVGREARGFPEGEDGEREGGLEASGPTPAEMAELTDQLEHLLSALDAEARQVVELKLQDYTNEEVAERMGCSERTVRRLLGRVKERLGRALEGPET